MNDKNLKCEIVRDLLPSYIDGLTSDVTNQAVEEHLAACEDCRQIYERMKDPDKDKEENQKEVDYLKKIRKHTRKMVLRTVIIALLVTLAGFVLKLFVIGTNVSPDGIYMTVEGDSSAINVNGSLRSSATCVSHVSFTEENGIVELHVREALAGIYKDASFQQSYTAKDPVHTVMIGNRIIWEDGVSISETASRLYKSKNSYVGDNSADSNITQILGIEVDFGEYTMELQTEGEPYGMTIVLKDTPDSKKKAIMQSDSILLLAEIKNLDSVTWKTENGEQAFSMTTSEASELVGVDIKKAANSPSELQTLLDLLHIR